MFFNKGNLVFIQWSASPSDVDHIPLTQTLDLEAKLGCFGEAGD